MKKALTFFGWPLLILPTLIMWTGLTFNEIAVHANQGRMPVYAADCQELLDMQPDAVHKCMTPNSHAKVFGDILVSDTGIASIGDMLIDFSDKSVYLCGLLWATMGLGCIIRRTSTSKMGPNSTDRIVAYFVRHGQTTLNAEGKFRGPSDPPLDEVGHNDAAKLAAYFKSIPLGDAWTSDKTRAVQTAETILDPKSMVASQTPDLHALNVGYLAGEKKDDSANQASIGYHQDNPDEAFPKGESINDFRRRVKPVVLRAIHAGWKSGKPSLVVAHSSVIHELGNIVHGDHTATLVRPGGVAAVTFDGKAFSANPIIRAANKKDAYAA